MEAGTSKCLSIASLDEAGLHRKRFGLSISSAAGITSYGIKLSIKVARSISVYYRPIAANWSAIDVLVAPICASRTASRRLTFCFLRRILFAFFAACRCLTSKQRASLSFMSMLFLRHNSK